MLQQVVLQTATPTPVTLKTFDIDAVDPDETIIITSISGLSPADLTLFTGDFARDGGYYQGRRTGKRNPVFNLKLNPDYTNDIAVSDLREQLYRWFLEPSAAADGLAVVLIDDRKPDRYFIGYTEKFPADIFAQKPTAQVSMLCVDPFLKSVDAVHFADSAGLVSTPIEYEGTADTGMELTVKVVTATNKVTVDLSGVSPAESLGKMTLTKPTGNYAVNDLIYINTVIGSRAIKLNGVDIMAQLDATSKWINLSAVESVLSTYGGAVSDGKTSIVDYAYRASWWGV